MRTAVQLYTLRALDEPLDRTLERVADAGFAGVEFAGLPDDTDPAAVAGTLDALDLGVAGAHVPYGDLDADPDDIVGAHRVLGVETLVVPFLDRSRFADREAVAATARDLDALAAAVGERGFALAYHTHDHEFAPLDGERAFDRLLAESSVAIELDAGWALAAGSDPVALLDAYGDRIDLLHLKDVALDADDPRGGRPTDLGEGDLDATGLLDAARAADAEWVVFEHDDPADPAASLARAGEFLRGRI